MRFSCIIESEPKTTGYLLCLDCWESKLHDELKILVWIVWQSVMVCVIRDYDLFNIHVGILILVNPVYNIQDVPDALYIICL